MNNRQKAQVALARVLINHIRSTNHPSVTQMNLLEEMIPRGLAPAYFSVLLEKVAHENYPSNSMLARISRLTEMM